MIVMKIGMLTLVLNEWIIRYLQMRSLLPRNQNTVMTKCIGDAWSSLQKQDPSRKEWAPCYSTSFVLSVKSLPTFYLKQDNYLNSRRILKSYITAGLASSGSNLMLFTISLTEVSKIVIVFVPLCNRIRSSLINPLVSYLYFIFYLNTFETWASSVLANLPRTLGWLSAKTFLQAYWKSKNVINK